MNENPGNYFILSDRGECSFVKKSFYSQLIGAKMNIIVDNKEENLGEIIMVDDGLGRDFFFKRRKNYIQKTNFLSSRK